MEHLKEWWAVIAAGVGALAWIIRMEGRMLVNSKEIERLWEQRKLDMEAAKDDRAEVKAMLKELRADIKELTSEINRRTP